MKKVNSRGFTLAELLIVISILGVLTLIIMVNFRSGTRSNELRQAGLEFSQNLRLAQSYTIGGNSLMFCDESSPEIVRYNECIVPDDTPCDTGICVNTVPRGGYGISIASTENYWIFGDKKNNNYFDGDIYDFGVVYKDLSYKSLHIKEIKLGEEDAIIPNDTDNRIDVTFEPPTGIIHFFVGGAGGQEAEDSSGDLINKLEILITSDYVTSYCRKISINRISGQISEVQSECSL
ncbi:prepilin-type N-terminal cleavage/methylation domain-containing protein [Patescibacteria group bacterium]|nr:prepilin-type N-terminal cleavage/methylation domain-containing protein [Patescibacteria group bacterium]MBU0964481.1 prepilin-type N-terminal cleavage/methylation domain-containing protein [Patescibacteria group bacterium]